MSALMSDSEFHAEIARIASEEPGATPSRLYSRLRSEGINVTEETFLAALEVMGLGRKAA